MKLHDNFDSVLSYIYIVFPSSQSTLPSTLPSVVFLSTFGSMLTVFTLSIIITIAVIAWRLKQRKKRIEGIARLYTI